mgnify:FL=1
MANKTPTKLRVGDDVVVISGAHKGSTGTIMRFNGDRSRVFVEGVNVVCRHERPVPALGRPGGIREKEASIHISNVAFQSADGATRLGYKRLDDGTKVRVNKKTQEVI